MQSKRLYCTETRSWVLCHPNFYSIVCCHLHFCHFLLGQDSDRTCPSLDSHLWTSDRIKPNVFSESSRPKSLLYQGKDVCYVLEVNPQAIDVWFVGCMLVVFAGAIHYFVAQHLLRKHVANVRRAKIAAPNKHITGGLTLFSNTLDWTLFNPLLSDSFG